MKYTDAAGQVELAKQIAFGGCGDLDLSVYYSTFRFIKNREASDGAIADEPAKVDDRVHGGDLYGCDGRSLLEGCNSPRSVF
jgi:hypothetical protein